MPPLSNLIRSLEGATSLEPLRCSTLSLKIQLQISVLLPVGGAFLSEVIINLNILTLFTVHDTRVRIKNDEKSLRINQETALALQRPLIFHRLRNLSQRVLI